MQSGLIETPNHDVVTTNTQTPPPSTAQHGPGRFRSGSPNARSLSRPRSLSSGTQRSGRAASDGGGLDVGPLDQSLGRLSVAEAESAAATRVTVAGQRIADYENAAAASSPRTSARPAVGFKVIHSSLSAGVQLTDFPNGSFCLCPRPGACSHTPATRDCCSGPLT